MKFNNSSHSAEALHVLESYFIKTDILPEKSFVYFFAVVVEVEE